MCTVRNFKWGARIKKVCIHIGQGSATFFDERAKSYNTQNFPDFKEPFKKFVSI